MHNIKALTFGDLERDTRPGAGVWVVNKTHETEVGDYAEVVFSIGKPGGNGRTNITVPATWLPVNLTDYAPRSHLLDAPELRQTVQVGVLVLISEADAKALLADPRAIAEREILDRRAEAVQRAGSARSITDNASGSVVNVDGSGGGANDGANARVNLADVEVVGSTGTAGQVSTDSAVKPNFVFWCNRVKELPEAELLTEIQRRGSARMPEVKYMIEAFSNHPNLVKRLKAMVK